MSPWSRTPLVIARGRCRLRWFRLQGLPAPERLAALRLQVQAWAPFEHTDARVAVLGEQGLAVAWDAAALERDILAAGRSLDRFQPIPETFAQPAMAPGLHVRAGIEGHEAQQWVAGQLVASRWWPQPLSDADWAEFVRASGASRDAAQPPRPQPQAAAGAPAWIRAHALSPSADQVSGGEHRLVFLGALGLVLGAGVMAHQLWGAHAAQRQLQQQIDSLKAAAGPVVAARDATLSQVADIEKLAAWLAAPQPIDVIGHLHDTLARTGVQIMELALEGDKLRVSLQLGPNTGRANVVKELQGGGWFTDVTEARADNSRNLLTMDMRIRGALPPVAGPAGGRPADAPGPTAAVPAGGGTAPSPAPAAAVQAVVAPPRTAPTPVPPPAAAPNTPPAPLKPIMAKPNADGLPPSSVFDAIPNR